MTVFALHKETLITIITDSIASSQITAIVGFSVDCRRFMRQTKKSQAHSHCFRFSFSLFPSLNPCINLLKKKIYFDMFHKRSMNQICNMISVTIHPDRFLGSELIHSRWNTVNNCVALSRVTQMKWCIRAFFKIIFLS